MQSRFKCVFSFIVVLVAASACDTEEESPYDEPLGSWVDDEGRLSFRNYEDNSQVMNGAVVNGRRLNGRRLNSDRVGGFALKAFSLNGLNMTAPTMAANQLSLVDANAQTVVGTDLEGLRIEMEYEDPETLVKSNWELSHTEMETLSSGLIMQTIKQRQLPGGSWQNACENDAKSIQLRGQWNEDTATLISSASDRSTWACAGAALADCALWGYVPGKTHGGTSLDGYHQTCLRAKRADYCGTGIHHTENGHQLDIYDDLGVMVPVTVGLWDVEAMWGPDGAICMNFTRKYDYTKDSSDVSKAYIGCEVPACVDGNNDGVIDFVDYPSALIADRTVPKWKVN